MEDSVDAVDEVETAGDVAKDTSVEALIETIKQLRQEKLQSLEEFGHQRAKMKELYLQKDEEVKRLAAENSQVLGEMKKLSSELDEAKSQLVVEGFRMESDLEVQKRKCQEEIASLQQLVQETVEESSSCRSKYEAEVKRLRHENRRLESEIQELRGLNQHNTSDKTDIPSLGPGVMLSAVTKTIARKVVQLGADASGTSQDNLEDSMRKVNKYAQEDAEVLRSLVIPLEEEIQALKEKLRYMDQLLRKYEGDTGDSFKIADEFGATQTEHIVGAENAEASPNKVDNLINMSNSEPEAAANFEPEVLCSHAASSLPNKQEIVGQTTPALSSLESHPATGAMSKQSCEVHSPFREDQSRLVTDTTSDRDMEGGGSPASIHSRLAPCDMCSNYEAQLVRAQQRTRELEKQTASLERTVERYREDLSKESAFRKDMEDKWNEKKEEHKQQVTELKKKMEKAEEALQELRQTYTQTYSEVTEKLISLTQDREKVQEQLTRLQRENDSLVGKHNMHSQQLQNEIINFPSNVEDLQELLLRYREELIDAKVAKEAVEEQEKTLRCEIQLLREQMKVEQEGRELLEDNLTMELNSLKKTLHMKELECHKHCASLEKLNATITKNKQIMADFDQRLNETLRSKKQLEDTVAELRSRVGSLQQELDNSEIVQKDFVRLSQSLQVQLERIRDTDTEVRWQHDEDVEECPGCRAGFSITRKKQHCRHCGRIFCTSCLSHSVQSGPNRRASKVCDVCHTLLVRDTAPYFSTDPPHTPD